MSKEMLREYEIRLDQFPGVVITMEYDEAKRRSPSIQTSYGRAEDGIPQCVMNCPGKIKRINMNSKQPPEIVQAFALLCREGFTYFTAEPPPPPKPTPEPYEQEAF